MAGLVSSPGRAPTVSGANGEDRLASGLLRKEGYSVTRPRGADAPPADFLADRDGRKIFVVVLSDGEMDVESRLAAHLKRIAECSQLGETRVYVPWWRKWYLIDALGEGRATGVAVVPY